MFDTEVAQAKNNSQAQKANIHAATQELVDITEKLEKGLSFEVDLDNAKLKDVKSTQDALNQNIVTCIIGLDEISGKFGSQFASMQERTGFETFVGLFSKNSSEEMRTERIKKADISENLQDLITQSDQVVEILTESEKILISEMDAGSINLTKTVNLRKEVVDAHLDIQGQVENLIDEVIKLEAKIEQELDPKARTAMEQELVKINSSYNEAKREEQVMLAKSQTLENYVQKNQMHMESLEKSLSAQQVLINKIKIDTAQRTVLYEQYQQTLKISAQQQIAHKINEIGTETDEAIQKGMAQAGHAAQNQVIDMLEDHNDIMKANDQLKQKSKVATDHFLNRFSEQIQRHNTAKYD
jgi:hypothetical protein